MKKLSKSVLFILIIFAAYIIFSMSTVEVMPNQKVVIKRFGQFVNTYEEPGLYFKMPMIDSNIVINKAKNIYLVNDSTIITKDKNALVVSSFVVWRIDNPTKYLQTLKDESELLTRLEATVYSNVKIALSNLTSEEIYKQRSTLDKDGRILENIKTQLSEYGIVVDDVRVCKLDLPDENKKANYDRMISERNKLAAQYEAEGEESATKIKNNADREKSAIISKAASEAQKIIAEGEQEYMRVLQESSNTEDKVGFYEFIRSMDALKKMASEKNTIILDKENPLAKYFYGY